MHALQEGDNAICWRLELGNFDADHPAGRALNNDLKQWVDKGGQGKILMGVVRWVIFAFDWTPFLISYFIYMLACPLMSWLEPGGAKVGGQRSTRPSPTVLPSLFQPPQ